MLWARPHLKNQAVTWLISRRVLKSGIGSRRRVRQESVHSVGVLVDGAVANYIDFQNLCAPSEPRCAPHLCLVGVAMRMERGCQQHDSLADG